MSATSSGQDFSRALKSVGDVATLLNGSEQLPELLHQIALNASHVTNNISTFLCEIWLFDHRFQKLELAARFPAESTRLDERIEVDAKDSFLRFWRERPWSGPTLMDPSGDPEGTEAPASNAP